MIPDLSNPQSWNRYSYVTNRPVNFNDPTGHCAENGDDWCYSSSNPTVVSTSTPTVTPTVTPSPTSTRTPMPTPTGVPSPIDIAISYIQDSPTGKSRYDLMISQGYKVDYSGDLNGYLKGNKILVPNTASPVYIAGTIAHESMHYKAGSGSLYQEYVAYLMGSTVMTEVVNAGHGSKSDITIPLSNFTVDLDNPDRKALSNDLRSWFRQQRLNVYSDPKSQGGYQLPAMPLARDLDRDR